MSKPKLIGPVTLEAKVHIASDDGSLQGDVTVSLPPGQVPTQDALNRVIGQALHSMPEGYRLMTPFEFINGVLLPDVGVHGRYAVPASFQYDLDAVTAAGRAAYTPDANSEAEAAP